MTFAVSMATSSPAVRCWATEHRRAFDADVLAVILAGRSLAEQWSSAHETRGNYWTRTQVNHLLGKDVPNACGLLSTRRPENDAEQLWNLLHCLASTGLLHFDSDELPDLVDPLHCYAGLDPEGNHLTDEQLESTPPHPCRCYRATDKQIRLGLEVDVLEAPFTDFDADPAPMSRRQPRGLPAGLSTPTGDVTARL